MKTEHWETQKDLYGTLDQWAEVVDIENFTTYVYNGTCEADLVQFIAEHQAESEQSRFQLMNDPFAF